MEPEDPYSMYERARRFEVGDSAPADLRSARELYEAAADGGVVQANVSLGRLIERGAAKPEELSEAARKYRTAALADVPEGWFHLGRLLFDLEEWEEAAAWLDKASRHGDEEARVWLAKCWEEGRGVARDLPAAIEIYERFATSIPEARIRLANCYHRGLGVAKDVDEAERLFRLAADLGQSQGWYGLGAIQRERDLSEGSRVDRSIGYFERAAADGLAIACEYCGEHYAYGRGGDPDFARALSYLRRAAAFELPDALCALGMLFLQGSGVPIDKAHAFELLNRSAARGSAHSMFLISLMLERGDGVSRDSRLARAWLRRAAAAGSERASEQLAARSNPSRRRSWLSWLRRRLRL